MNPNCRKFISLFLIFSLVMLSTNLYAKERRGAKLLIIKLDGQLIEGELITVKSNSLLLLDTEGKDVSIDFSEIQQIRIVKKSKGSLGAGIGGAIGGGIGLYKIVSAYNASVEGGFYSYLLLGSLVVPAAMIVGAVIGGGVGALVRGDDVIYLTGMTDTEIQETLEYLRKKARIRNYK